MPGLLVGNLVWRSARDRAGLLLAVAGMSGYRGGRYKDLGPAPACPEIRPGSIRWRALQTLNPDRARLHAVWGIADHPERLLARCEVDLGNALARVEAAERTGEVDEVARWRIIVDGLRSKRERLAVRVDRFAAESKLDPGRIEPGRVQPEATRRAIEERLKKAGSRR